MGLFKVERILLSTEEFFALHRGIADATTDPAIGLKLGAEERIERYDPVKLAALSARSFRDAVERSARYKQLTCPEEIRLVERGNECESRWRSLDARRPRAVRDAPALAPARSALLLRVATGVVCLTRSALLRKGRRGATRVS